MQLLYNSFFVNSFQNQMKKATIKYYNLLNEGEGNDDDDLLVKYDRWIKCISFPEI